MSLCKSQKRQSRNNDHSYGFDKPSFYIIYRLVTKYLFADGDSRQ